MKKVVSFLLLKVFVSLSYAGPIAPKIYEVPIEGCFPLVSESNVANIYCDADDYIKSTSPILALSFREILIY